MVNNQLRLISMEGGNMVGRIKLLGLITLGLMLITAADPVSALMVKMSMNEIVQESETIVFGTVTEEVAFKVNGDIFTDYTIYVENMVLGESDGIFHLRLLCGELPFDMGCWYSDRPRIAVGERVILFVKDDPRYPVAGEYQGKFTIDGNIVRENGKNLDNFLGEIELLVRGKTQ